MLTYDPTPQQHQKQALCTEAMDCKLGYALVQVMVWIHGGGLVVGGASTYDGLALSAHENVVVVTIQYRLSIWGFFR